MRKLSLILTAALALTACSQSGPSEDAAPSSTLALPSPAPETTPEAEPTEPTPTEDAGPPRNERGNIVKKLGEAGGIFWQASPADEKVEVVTFAVDSINPVTCNQEFAGPAENGHMIALDMRVATAPELAQTDMNYFSVSNSEFSFIGSDGVTVNNIDTMATYGCLAEGEMFTYDTLSPGSQYRGKVVLDVPEPHGTIVYKPSMVFDGTGWEWSF